MKYEYSESQKQKTTSTISAMKWCCKKIAKITELDSRNH